MDAQDRTPTVPDRRSFLEYAFAMGLGVLLFPRALWARLRRRAVIDVETVRCAEEIAGLDFSDAHRQLMLDDLRQQRESYEAVRRVPLANRVPPALRFDPLAGREARAVPPTLATARPAPRVDLPGSAAEVAFLPVAHVAELVRTRRLGAEELTRLYLDRIGRLDPLLHAVITVTEERALRQARTADTEIAGGRYRGALHGIPWGAKDLLAVAGYPTTWGTAPFRNQSFAEDAEVVRLLDEAGAVLIGKLSLGELARGDVWYGGTTRNPWNVEQGASGSSGGPAAATAAGLVGFSVGSETLGSISSPSSRTGVTGLRPTYGRVSTEGAMALSWSMDKLGPLCRSAADCALVLEVIQSTANSGSRLPFRAAAEPLLSEIRVGYLRSAFEGLGPAASTRPFDVEALETLRGLGVAPIPVELPSFPYRDLSFILFAEAAAAFDELTRSGRDEEMTRQGRDAWPNTFRAARSIPAVEYINANRVRTLAMAAWAELFESVDVILTPTDAPDQLIASNLTGHPALVLPSGFRPEGTPVSVTLLGGLFQEASLLAVGRAFQDATGHHLRHPDLEPQSAP